MAATEVDR